MISSPGCTSKQNYAAAAGYHQKASQLVNSPTNIGNYTKKFYEVRVAEMQALIGGDNARYDSASQACMP